MLSTSVVSLLLYISATYAVSFFANPEPNLGYQILYAGALSTEEICILVHSDWLNTVEAKSYRSRRPEFQNLQPIESFDAIVVSYRKREVKFWCRDVRQIRFPGSQQRMPARSDGPWLLKCPTDHRIEMLREISRYTGRTRSFAQCVEIGNVTEKELEIKAGTTECQDVQKGDTDTAEASSSLRFVDGTSGEGALSWSRFGEDASTNHLSFSLLEYETDTSYLRLTSMARGQTYRGCARVSAGRPNQQFSVQVIS